MYKKTEKNYFLVMGLYVILFLCVYFPVFLNCALEKEKLKQKKKEHCLPKYLFPLLNCELLEGKYHVLVIFVSPASSTVPGII